MQQDVLNARLSEADHAPVHLPPGASTVPAASERKRFLCLCLYWILMNFYRFEASGGRRRGGAQEITSRNGNGHVIFYIVYSVFDIKANLHIMSVSSPLLCFFLSSIIFCV